MRSPAACLQQRGDPCIDHLALQLYSLLKFFAFMPMMVYLSVYVYL